MSKQRGKTTGSNEQDPDMESKDKVAGKWGEMRLSKGSKRETRGNKIRTRMFLFLHRQMNAQRHSGFQP